MEAIRSMIRGVRRWRLIAIVYMFQLLLALTLGLQVYQVIEASLGHSMSLERMISKFDYTVLQDLFNIHGASLSPLIGKLRWYVIAYIIFSAFINAGIWSVLAQQDNTAQDWTCFWKGGAKYFGRFLVVGVVLLVLFAIWTALIWAPYAGSFINMMETWMKDNHIIWLGLLLFIVWIHGVTFLFVWGSYSRASIVTATIPQVWQSIRSGFIRTIRRFIRLLPSLWLSAFVLFLLYFLVVFLESVIGIRSEGLILAFFFLQQLIVWLKIGHRVGVYDYLYRDSLK